MKTRLLFVTAALLGAIAILWMGLDFIGTNILALAVTVVIGFVYVLGLVELVQFRSATASLRSALDEVSPGAADDLPAWLARLHPSLQNAVSQRIQGERVGLPAPVFTPYLVGLLVMLGLLGTFIGMVDTLQGAVTALEGSTELSAIRAGLAAPIQGLGLAFGTSVAGVAASAMLGLNSTLSRRERMQATRQLDQYTGTFFKEHSLQYNRQQTFLAMQGQADALPRVAEQLTAMAGELERMGNTLSERLLENQQTFHTEAQAQYTALAESVGTSLKESLTQSGRLAGESIAPAVEQTMAQLASESRSTHEHLLTANQSHLAAVAESLDKRTADMNSVLADTTGQLAESARTESRGLVEEIGKLLASTEALVTARAANETSWLDDHGQRMAALTTALREELNGLREEEAHRNKAVGEQLSALQQTTAESLEKLQGTASEHLGKLESTTAGQLSKLESSSTAQLASLNDAAAEHFTRLTNNTSEQLTDLHTSAADQLAKLNTSTTDQLTELNNSTSEQLLCLNKSATEQFTSLNTNATEQLASLNSSAIEQIERLNSNTTAQLSSLETSATERLTRLEASAAEQLAALGRELEDPMTRLIETASETPKAAAEVIGKLREEVSNSLERDNQLLEERQQLMQELTTLTQSLQDASQNQQASITDFVSSSSGMLQSVSEEFREHLSGETSRLSDTAANVAGSAIEMASLGEAFGLAVQLFSESNQTLVENLSRIEDSMEKSTERSDEQMSYYVAQAREIIDQSMLSQREIIEELRRLGQTGDLFAPEAS